MTHKAIRIRLSSHRNSEQSKGEQKKEMSQKYPLFVFPCLEWGVNLYAKIQKRNC